MAPRATASNARTRPLVLVGEDSLVVREVLRWHLEEHGFDIVLTPDGVEVVSLAEELRPSVILLGVELAGIDGFRALASVKARPDLADTPVVFITGHTRTDDMVEALRLGAHDYLRKPFEPAEVIARVSAAVRVKQLQDDLRERNEELDRISRSDPLTGLANRRHLDEQLAMQLASARRHGHALSIALLDVDHFKAVNDTYGHAVGDAVLCELAKRISVAARSEDVIGRWGGEEFMLVLPHCALGDAQSVCERIRHRVAAAPIMLPDHDPIEITVSIGCTSGTDEELITRGDAALYEAKHSGRNRTIALPPSPG